MNPGHLGGPFLLSLILMDRGKLSDAKQVALSEPYHVLKIQALSLITTEINQLDSAAMYLSEIKENYAMVAPYQIAQVYAHLNEVDSAFKWLDLAYDYRDGGLVQLKADPFLRKLHADSRWKMLISKMEFP